MKVLLGCSLALLMVVPIFAADDPSPATAKSVESGFVEVDPFVQVKEMGRGVNILSADPIWRDFTKKRFQEKHFGVIHDGGFQTVRVNLGAFRHMNAKNVLDPAWLTSLDWVVKNALAAHLNVIVDEHDYHAMAVDAAGNKGKLLAFWEQAGERYKDEPNSVVFEMLNEPNGQLDAVAWNGLLKETLAVIRKTNPTRNVIIGPAFWNGIHYLDKLELPEGDRHIIVTVHYYLPMTFTHQGASWNPATAKLTGVRWGTDAEMKAVETDFAGVEKWSAAEKRPILLGEFGAYDKGDMESRAKYTAKVARTAEGLGWAWTYWEFDTDFLAYDMKKDEWVEPIWRALVPRE